MTSKFIKDLRSELRNLTDRYERSISRREMAKLGNFAAEMIRERTKRGFGVATFYEGRDTFVNRQQRLTKLSPRYIKYRRTFSGLDSTTTPGKSNLTLTGQMLRKLRAYAPRNGTVIIATRGKRRDGKSNEEVARYVSEKGRPWLDLSGSQEKKLARFYENKILKSKLRTF